MANQYFENNAALSHNIQKISYYYHGKKLTFYSDNGVFSKAGIDYGSNALLKNIALDKEKNLSLLDVGCGYGTIGQSLACLYSKISVDMVDVNDRAIDLCNKAIAQNELSNARCFHSDVYQNVDKCDYDVIVSNPPIRAGKSVVHSIIIGAYEHLKSGGSLWCVIQKKQGAPSAYKALEVVYKSVEVVENDKGYWIIKACK